MGTDVSYSLLKDPDGKELRTLRSQPIRQRFNPLKPKTLGRIFRLSLSVLLLVCFLSESTVAVQARSRRAVTGRSRHSAGGSFRTGRFVSSSRSKRSSRSSLSRSSSRKGGKAHPLSARTPSHHGPTAAQVRRQETSGSNDLEKRTDLERAYRTYDQGLSEWLAGNYGQAAKYLNESYDLYSDFHGSRDVLDSIYLYDLGQAAEAAGDISLAKNSYQRSLRRRPDFCDCCIRLTALLTKNGETALALVYARRLADKNPQDPRSQFLLATMLDKAGFTEEGKIARSNFNLLMKGGTLPNSATSSTSSTSSASTSTPKNQEEQSVTDSPSSKFQGPASESTKSEQEEKVEKDEGVVESGSAKNSNSSGKENGATGGALRKPDSESEGK